MASTGGSLYDPTPLIQEELCVAVLEEGLPVCCNYLVDRCGATQQEASEALGRFAEACEGQVEVSYLLTGVDQHRVPRSVMTTGDVYTAAQQFAEPPHVAVYGVAPKGAWALPAAADAPMLPADEYGPPAAHPSRRRAPSPPGWATCTPPAGIGVGVAAHHDPFSHAAL